MTRFRAGSATDVGRVRETNQDSCLVAGALFAVADGMGGHNGGEVASRLAIDALREGFDEPSTDALVDAVQLANDLVIGRADDDQSLRGMGTTLVVLASVETDGEPRLAVANVGDSRCYLLDEGGLRQVTKDHSVVQTLVDNGQISRSEAEVHPQRNILTRALGIDARVMTDSWELLPFTGDRYLLCSDGLFGEVGEDDIADVLRRLSNPGDAASELVRMANDAGGHDNISVVVVDVVDDEGRPEVTVGARSRVAVATTGGHRAIADAESSTTPGSGGDEGSGGVATADATGDEGANGAKGQGGVVVDAGAPSRARAGRAEPTTAATVPTDRPRRVTFRTVVFVFVLAAVLVTILGALVFASRSTYFVTYDGDEVAIFQGRPGGFLWIDPSVDSRTGISRADVPASYRDELEEEKEFGSLSDARDYVDRMRAEIEEEAERQEARTSTDLPPPTTGATDPQADGSDEPAGTGEPPSGGGDADGE